MARVPFVMIAVQQADARKPKKRIFAKSPNIERQYSGFFCDLRR
jgi:hypothetical protein